MRNQEIILYIIVCYDRHYKEIKINRNMRNNRNTQIFLLLYSEIPKCYALAG